MSDIDISPIGSFATHLGDGLLRGTDGSGWLYWVLPRNIVVFDADDERKTDKAGNPLLDLRDTAAAPLCGVFGALSDLVPQSGLKYRNVLRGSYREFQLLAASPRVGWRPSDMLPPEMRVALQRDYPDMDVLDRISFFGVKLQTGGIPGRNPLVGALDRVSALLDTGTDPVESFERDRGLISRIFAANGLRPPTAAEADRLLNWWQPSPSSTTVPVFKEPGHLHVMATNADAQMMKRYHDTGAPCDTWPRIDHSLRITLVNGGPMHFMGDADDVDDAGWMARLLADPRAGGDGAVAVSVRGVVEPGWMTAAQFRRDQQTVTKNIEEISKQGEFGRMDKHQVAGRLDAFSELYETGAAAPPTLIETSCIMALPGVLREDDAIGYPGRHSIAMHRQDAAFLSMMPCSPIRWQPMPLYWTSDILSYSGPSGRTTAGDTKSAGALLGFSESDRQPVYVSAEAAHEIDATPYFVVLGASGSGKTLTLLNLAWQWSRLPSKTTGRPTRVVMFDPKQEQDFTGFVKAVGGRIIRMDDAALSDGILDPLRSIADASEAMRTACIMLTEITDPHGTDPRRETDIKTIIAQGTALGADCLGQAFRRAAQARAKGDRNIPDTVEDIGRQLEALSKSDNLMRMIYGLTQGGPSLKVGDGLTVLSAGSENVMPTSGANVSVTGRIQQWLIRMVLMGAGSAVRGTHGVVIIDEAHVALGEGSAEIAAIIGRLARSQKYLPVMASQQVKEFLDANLQGYVSRMLLLSLSDKGSGFGLSEAQAALRLAGHNESGRYRRRMPLPAETDAESHAPQWDSLKALRRAGGSEVIRGSVGLYFSFGMNPVPVEIPIPDRLFSLLSTRESDRKT